MDITFLSGYELPFLIDILLASVGGYIIGSEREARGKPAGVSTHMFVIVGAMLFSFVSSIVDPFSKTRIASQIVTGVGFLGAGMILKGDNGTITNLTTAASIWFAAGIGTAIGFNLYSISVIGITVAFIIPKISYLQKKYFQKN